ncbi:hypothetical protein IMCC20628_04804 (plasmid) [Hoeflea sp. IMCC20628]|uniref:hypothetical protein n=1 Tax=Hoeflea sp. IMCC20628 TaxID=1620421 RepID=UPI00063AE973|nr:hypothetical protein [Hoeflea sp. IMCC20628]AKI03470.1 hypothetical protein IMCC20628_04804 [Hoeflea sp. IMCC20628]
MSRLATSFVLGYHGCDGAVARKAVLDGVEIIKSDRDYDWLGPGAYFWESDPKRALEWAQWKVSIGQYKEASVIGAVIDLRSCLDLVSREDIEILRAAHASFVKVQKTAALPVPKNTNPKGAKDPDRVLRFLDCAVFRHLHQMIDEIIKDDPSFEPFDTIRGMFVEGGKAFTGSGIYMKSHVQIAVRNAACIKGIFYPLNSN